MDRPVHLLVDYFSYIAGLLPQLPDGGLLGRFTLVDHAGRELDYYFAGGRPKLLLEQDLRACWFLQDGKDLNGVHGAALRARGTLHGLPGPGPAVRVLVVDPGRRNRTSARPCAVKDMAMR
jgi:hypothetical protein